MERSSYETTRNALNKLRKKDEMLFRMAISHWTDVGTRHLTESNIEATCKSMMKEDDSHSFMTNEYKCALVRMAGEIAKFDHVHVLVYIQNEMTYDVGQKEITHGRLVKLLENCMEWIDEMSSGSEDFKDTLMNTCGFEIEEIKQLGFGYCLTEEEYQEE